MTPALVVLAAGRGRRYGGDKQVDGVGPGGRALLEYTIRDAVAEGLEPVVIVTRRELHADVARRAARAAGGKRTVVVDQRLDDLPRGSAVPPAREAPWGTGHAVLVAARAVEGPFLVANADDLYGRAALAAVARCVARRGPSAGAEPPATAEPRSPACVATFRLDRTLSKHGGVSRAVCDIDDDGRLLRMEEVVGIRRAPDGDIAGRGTDGRALRLGGDEPVSMNLWGLPAGIVGELERGLEELLGAVDRGTEDRDAELRLPDVVAKAVAAGRLQVRCVPCEGEWLGLTHAADRCGVRDALARREVERCC